MKTEYRVVSLTTEGRKLVAVYSDPAKADKFLEVLRGEHRNQEYPRQFEILQRIR